MLFTTRILLSLLYVLPATMLAQSPGKSGVSPSVISLPAGPGAIEGLGPSFEPQLNTGTATYGVPIAIPPGVAGHAPDIDLSYNSGNGNGFLGIGWSLDFPTIQRQLDKGLPDYTGATASAATEDTFLYNGEELVPLNDGSYRCEIESEFVRFRKIPAVPKGPVNAWEGTLPDGRRMIFGASPEERVTRAGGDAASFADTYSWKISTFIDTSGNAIRYQYETFEPESTGVLFPSRIEYARFGDNIHHRVEFTYSGSSRFPGGRTDVFSDFRPGFEIRTSKLLREIAVFTDGRLVRRYVLYYERDPDLAPSVPGEVKLGFSLLQNITQFDSSGHASNYLPPLRFAYSRFDTQSMGSVRTDLAGGFRPVTGGFNFLRFGAPLTETIDINSDGLPDFISSGSGSWHAYLNQGGGKFSDELPFTANAGEGTDQANGKRLDEPAITLADLDGDGVTDLFQKAAASPRILMHRNPNDFTAPSTLDATEMVRWGPEIEFTSELQTGAFGAMDIADPSIRMLDLNFDKRTDAMRPFDLGDGTGGIEYIMNGPEGWKSEMVFEPDPRLPPDWSADEARFIRPNIAVRTSGLADLNGDRMEDWYTLAIVGEEVWIDYWPNANGGFWGARESTERLPMAGVRADELRLLDVNADGLTDLVLVRHLQLTFWVNTGADQWSDAILRNDAPPYLEGLTVIRQLDVNGNGTVDLFWDNSNLAPGTLPDGASRFVYFDFVGELKPNLLTIIDNGIGLRTFIQYKSSTEDYLAALKSGNPWTTKLPFPIMVVGRTIEDIGLDLNADGKPDQYITDITYRDGYYDSFEKEFRGFAFVEEIERGDDYNPDTGETIPGTGTVSGPSLVTRYRYLTGTPDGADNDDYLPSYTGVRAIDEGTGTGGAVVSFTDDLGGREEEALKGLTVFEETIDPAVLYSPAIENSGFHACARATALAARVDPSDPRAFRCTPDKYVYNRSRTEWKVRRLYRPDGLINPPGRFADSDDPNPVHALARKSVSFALAVGTENQVIDANGYLREQFDGKPVGYPVRPPAITRSETGYDDYGNVVFSADYGIVQPGNMSVRDDERITRTSYILNAAALAGWLIRFPTKERVEDENGVFVSETRFYYDGEELVGLPLGQIGSRGLLKRTEKLVTDNPSLLPALETYDPARIDRQGDPRLPAGSFIVASRVAHDVYGNAIVVMDPLGSPGDVDLTPSESSPVAASPAVGNNGHFRIIGYDQTRPVFPTSETVVIGKGKEDLLMEIVYEPGFGVVTRASDWNGHQTSFHYDSFGRLVKIVRPGDSLDKPTERFLYRPADSQRNVVYQYSDEGNLGGGVPTSAVPPAASAVETRAREDLADSSDYKTFDSMRYTSGAGQELMNLAEDEQQGRWVISEAINYNLRKGRLAASLAYYRTNAFYHRAGALGIRLDGLSVSSADRIEFFQDPVGRTIRTISPPETFEGPRSTALAQQLPFETRGFDPNDSDPTNPNFETPTVYLSDGLHRLTSVEEITRLEDDGTTSAALKSWTTRYTHNLHGRLISIEDSQHNVQWFRYDGLGRIICKNDPDRGIRTYRHDDAGNTIEELDAKGQKATFTYDGVNRILTEDYHDEGSPFSFNRQYDPSQSVSDENQPDVAYFYDTFAGTIDSGNGDRVTPSNLRGTLVRVVDLAGENFSSFDTRGRVAWELRRFPDPQNGKWVSYQTRLQYDSMDRIVEVTYPDEDKVRYAYNGRNLLNQIKGAALSNAGGTPYIVTQTRYTPSGAPDLLEFGNGLVTKYRYDPRLRISTLITAENTSQPILAYQYHFDPAANLLRIDDLRDTPSSASPQRLFNTQLMTYDDLNRLSSVVYPQDPLATSSPSGRVDYRYDRIGNMLLKNSNINQRERGLPVADLGEMNYGNELGRRNRIGRTGPEAGPHALTSTSSGYACQYDKNGNITQLDKLKCEWDFRDRLVAVEDDTSRAEYIYDHQDRRTVRKVTTKTTNPPPASAAAASYTLYVSKYFEIRDHGQPVKYVWHGDRRLARISGTVDQNAQRLQRWRAWAGWNLLSCAVTAADGAAQLGLGSDSNIVSVCRWEPSTGSYLILGPNHSLSAGDIIWVLCAADGNLKVRGIYPEPTLANLSPGGNFVGSFGLHFLPIPAASLPPETDVWFYGSRFHQWESNEPLTFSPQRNWTLEPGAAAYLQASSATQLVIPEPELQIQYYHDDPLNSVNLVTDGAGNIIEESVFYPFGHPRVIRSVAEDKGILPGHYRFAQKEQDGESGLTYFESRYLASALGRFNRVDPIGDHWPAELLRNPQALNSYSYCNNNPFKFQDPDGFSGVVSRAISHGKSGARASKGAARSAKPASLNQTRPNAAQQKPLRKADAKPRNPEVAAAKLLRLIKMMRIPATDKLAFWSGSKEVPVDKGKKGWRSQNRTAAEKSENMALGNTLLGRLVENDPVMQDGAAPWDVQAEVWKAVSQKLASSATGTVEAWVVGATEKSVWNTVELPTLMQNKNVSAIIMRDPANPEFKQTITK